MKDLLKQVSLGFGILGIILVGYLLTEFTVRHTSEQGDTSSPAVEWDNVIDDGARLTITWLGSPYFASGREGAYIEKLLEERYNLELKPIFLDSRGHQRKKPLIIASGEVPDVVYVGGPSDIGRYQYHGLIAEVPYEVIRKYAPTYVETINHYAPFSWLYSRADGGNFGLPTLYYSGVYATPGLWRGDWLKKLGWTKTPETVEEFHEAFRGIAHEDPDGNGLNDTYGLSFDVQGYYFFYSEIFAAHGVIPFDFIERDDKIVYGGLLPETLETLVLLRNWYEEGLIDPEFVTDRQELGKSLYRKFLSGRTGYLPHGGGWNNLNTDYNSSFIHSLRRALPEAEFTVANFPIGPRGEAGQRVWSRGGNVVCFGKDVTSNPVKVIRVLRMLEDMISDPEFFMETMAGKRGTHWDFTGPEFTYGEEKALLEPYNSTGASQREVLNLGAGFFNVFPAKPGIPELMTGRKKETYLKTYQLEHYGRSSAFGKNDVIPSAAMILDDLYEYQKSVFVKIIRGDLPLSAFEVFKSEWLKRGGETLLVEAQEMREQRNIVYQKIGYKREADK